MNLPNAAPSPQGTPSLAGNYVYNATTNSWTDHPLSLAQHSLVAGDLTTTSSKFGLDNALVTTGVQESGGPPTNSLPGLDQVARLNQFIAAGFPDQHGALNTNALSQISASEVNFLANPHHG
jgi:hypothetical protein